ncbi:DnaJ domain-containing protein [Mariniblastus fucicola]|uniref:Chaperone protein DnaJ n=1 Tax=Mariniblastus fucicola TaxID=980251 RepID=A0A5B9PGD3_9BACT|nr:DnaJ domain-containing protein [Mariniblastus fucicola]QEG24310.1 Chaperone protein DnaJ [Mariniblastus fucicola]
MSTDQDFVDYYETLEASCNASFETIERTFRFLAKRFHPDCSEQGDRLRFTEIVEAYETLRDPEKRAAYDAKFESFKSEQSEIIREAGHASSDTADRHRLLTLFYAQRRRNMNSPGIGVSTLEEMMGLPTEVLDFHIWYFREKGWLNREESGTLSITAAGVDKIESKVEKEEEAAARMRITQSNEAIALP